MFRRLPSRLVAGLAGAAALAGCAHRPVVMSGCNLPMSRLTIAEPSGGAVRRDGGADTSPDASPDAGAGAEPAAPAPSAYERALSEAVASYAGTSPRAQRPVLLMLSGGSQNGAFGAGFLDEWRVKGGGLPPFQVVTGVSTGALIGTTVFTGHSDRAVEGYTIDREGDLLKVEARGFIGAARKGAFGKLIPLRQRIDELLDSTRGNGDDALLGEIAAAGGSGRRFLIGVVDAREGEAYTVDMTELAARWQAAAPAARPAIKACYIEALIASASVPLAAPPVYIDNRMLIDGGARFGLFRAAEARAVARMNSTRAGAGQPPAIEFLLLNTRWDTVPECPFEAPPGAACPASGTLRKWDVLGLAQRSVGLLTNQIYRFSILDAAREGQGVHYDRLGPDAGAHVFNGRSCADWRAADRAVKPAPIEFHPQEMRCLIDYGRARSRLAAWWQIN